MLGRPSRPKDRMQRTKLEIPFGHAFDRREVSSPKQMPVKIARSTPRPSFGLRELLVASHISRLASRDAAKSLLSTLVSESSGECRFKSARGEDCARKNRQFEPKNATPGLDRRRPATNGSALQGSSENRYHSPEAQGSCGRSRLITLTFFLSTPGVAEATAGGFPAISAAPGQFLLKDLVLLAASLSLLLASVQGQWLNVQKS